MGNNKVGFWPLAIVWGLTAAAFTYRAISGAATLPLLLDTDDAMRMTEVRDFLHGQNWFDIVQHRLNTPYGAEMHWSRLIDLPEATIFFLLRPVFGPLADTIGAYVWPLLLLVALLWLTAKLAIRLGGQAARWPALLLVPFSIVTLTEFDPGRLDHHSAQALLTLIMLYCAIAALERPRFAVGAGIAAAIALAIGIEGLPLAVVTVIAFALMWVGSTRHAVALRDFGLSFGLAMAVCFAQGVTPAEWLLLRLDAISIVYAGAALLAGLAFVVLSLLPLRTWPVRLVTALLFGGAIAAILLAVDPDILKGPYAALDPWLVTNWLSHISESATFLSSFKADPIFPLAVSIPTAVGILAAIWNAVRRPADRPAWLIYLAFLVMGVLVMIIQIRASRLVTPLAVPAAAVLLTTTWQAFRVRNRIETALVFIVTAAASAGVVVGLAVILIAPDNSVKGVDSTPTDRQCLLPSAFTDLAGLPPERIMAPVDIGSHLLAFTPHSVVAAPYHRDQQGLLDTFHFFNGPIEAGRAILEARGIGLVVICPQMAEIRGFVPHTPDSFITLYAERKLPGWLVDQSLPDSPLQIYAVTPR
jgi:hypothetical protein